MKPWFVWCFASRKTSTSNYSSQQKIIIFKVVQHISLTFLQLQLFLDRIFFLLKKVLVGTNVIFFLISVKQRNKRSLYVHNLLFHGVGAGITEKLLMFLYSLRLCILPENMFVLFSLRCYFFNEHVLTKSLFSKCLNDGFKSDKLKNAFFIKYLALKFNSKNWLY